jgi:uncharacterized membrane protein
MEENCVQFDLQKLFQRKSNVNDLRILFFICVKLSPQIKNKIKIPISSLVPT